MTSNAVEQFVEALQDSFDKSLFVNLIISNKRDKKNELRSVTIKPIQIKKGLMISFVYRYPTNDLTKNYSYSEAIIQIKEHIENTFYQGELFTTEAKWHLRINKKNKSKLSRVANIDAESPQLTHDKQKKRLISTEGNKYLKELGITNIDESIKPSMQDKFKQINKYIEIIEGVLKSVNPKKQFHIADMGSGKGYLTFALYDYLKDKFNTNLQVTGIEFRKELVDKCNKIAEIADFSNLKFQQGTIKESDLKTINMLIALHACDTATDDAIFRGIKAEAEIIICAPCCHKQIRKQVNPINELNLISQFGILKERQAEILTDTIRAQILEAYGYKTNVFEFISTEHTPKNVMITAIRRSDWEAPDKSILEKIDAIKKMHGIRFHYLEKLLAKEND